VVSPFAVNENIGETPGTEDCPREATELATRKLAKQRNRRATTTLVQYLCRI
jgi:hypothetical protein